MKVIVKVYLGGLIREAMFIQKMKKLSMTFWLLIWLLATSSLWDFWKRISGLAFSNIPEPFITRALI